MQLFSTVCSSNNWVLNGVFKALSTKAKEMDSNTFALYYSKVMLLNNRSIKDEFLKSINVSNSASIDIIYSALKN